MKNIALFSCDNGLGHIRRTSILANILSKNIKVTFFVNREKIKNFFIAKKIKIINFKINFVNKKKNFLTNNFIKKFQKKTFKNFNAIYSDTMPEVFYANKKVFIYANFLWHKEFKIKSPKYINLDKELFNRKTFLFANYLFYNKYLYNYNLIKVPFFKKFRNTKKKSSILLSFGTANYSQAKVIKKKIIHILKLNEKKKIKIFLEPKFYKKSYQKLNVYKATFSKEMYDQIAVAYIKPGFGTIEECLMRGIPIICYTKNTLNEFENNANIIKLKKLGFKNNNLKHGFLLALKILKNKKLLKIFEKRCNNLKWKGEKFVSEYMLKKLN
jgi:hypothetical protein